MVELLSTKLHSLDDLQASIERRNQHHLTSELTPISPGPVSGETLFVGSLDVRINYCSINNARTTGVIGPDALSFGTFLRDDPRNAIFGKRYRAGEPIILPPNYECEVVHKHNSQFVLFQFSKRLTNQKLDSGHLRFLPPDFRGGMKYSVNAETAASVCKRLRQIKVKIECQSGIVKSDRYFELIQNCILDIFLEAIENSLFESKFTSDHYLHNGKIVRSCKELLRQNPMVPPTVSDLACELGVNRRTIHRAFVKTVDAPPSRVIRRWRLAGAQRDLKSGATKSVSEAARTWGFWELGRFAEYYRQEFGELPSETLKKYS